jgi:hypothetical protein
MNIVSEDGSGIMICERCNNRTFEILVSVNGDIYAHCAVCSHQEEIYTGCENPVDILIK